MSDPLELSRRHFVATAAAALASRRLGLPNLSTRADPMTDALTQVEPEVGSPDIRPFRVSFTDIEVAERLGVSRFTVRSWRLKGVGPRFLKMGRAVRYRSQDVDEYERQALVETQASSDHSPM